ncbi:Protein of uncharacterised function (DUF1161) [Klebsiella pneumoniae]|nr:DUF1161 domain-containing protein [Klebsiella pneumoniae]SWQ11826.1 Protein of uncharacterised function (DUF1161) [Klebsiella pneumoniae]
MKLSLCTGAALLLCSTAVLAAPDSCERVKSDIQQKIINNGVPETAFSLAIVPNDQADQPGVQVVGHCANDTFKITYTRNSDSPAFARAGGPSARPTANSPPGRSPCCRS